MFVSELVSRLSMQIDPVAAIEQVIAKMRAEEARASGDDRDRHDRDCRRGSRALNEGFTPTQGVTSTEATRTC